MKKFILFLLAVIILAGCKGEAQQTVQAGDFKVDYLFEKDGCKVYRFSDAGHFVYFSDCRGKMEHTTTRQSGKRRTTDYHETMNN